MFFEFFNHDLNRLSWTEYEIRDEINHIRHIFIYANQFQDLVSPLTKVAQISKRRKEFVSLIVLRSGIPLQSLRQFHSQYRLKIADRIFLVLPLLVSELLTFNVNCSLNDDSCEAGEIL